MKVFIDGKLYDAEETAIVIIFNDDNEREGVIKHLSNMTPRNGQRYYAMYPAEKYTAAGIIQTMKKLNEYE